jgi:ferredoxin
MPERCWDGARDRPAGEAETYARLEAAVRECDMRACDGCTRCATRCVDGIDLSYPEFDRLIRAAMAMPPMERVRVLGQDRVLQWGEGAVVALCPFLDRDVDRCAIYAARPLICRLFGYAPWLPCPTGKQIDFDRGRGGDHGGVCLSRAPSLARVAAPIRSPTPWAIGRHTIEWQPARKGKCPLHVPAAMAFASLGEDVRCQTREPAVFGAGD